MAELGVRSSPEVVFLNRGNNITCTINLYGATVTSWKVFNIEQLFLSSEARFDNLFPIRGGISIIYTQYGFDNVFIPNHGFARTSHWSLEEEPTLIRDGDVRAVFTLKSDSVMRENYWPFDFTLKYIVILQEQSLTLKLSIYNGERDVPVKFNIAFMNYLKLSNAENCTISGLRHTKCVSRISKKVYRDERPYFNVDHWIDDVYYCVDKDIQLHNSIGLYSMRIKRWNLPDVGFWNPWTDTVHLVTCLNEEEIKEMVVVITGYILSSCTIPPQSWYNVFQVMEANRRDGHARRFSIMEMMG
ncbi:uncharacterized protein [Halyomorpha halys]|uniref:uncharacterized protein n=1 Tax=Halyomorpha halys TaxID=286706 RepID=UPI0006D4E491|nr:glucose-6-phosphate 1-epimerase-like [Halyomorpha halys]